VTAGSGAWAGVRRGAVAGALPEPPDVAAGKSVGPEPDDREQAAHHWAQRAEPEPCTRDAARFGEQSCEAEELEVRRAKSVWKLRVHSAASLLEARQLVARLVPPQAAQVAVEQADAVAAGALGGRKLLPEFSRPAEAAQ
jgi:hypothetical protein